MIEATKSLHRCNATESISPSAIVTCCVSPALSHGYQVAHMDNDDIKAATNAMTFATWLGNALSAQACLLGGIYGEDCDLRKCLFWRENGGVRIPNSM